MARLAILSEARMMGKGSEDDLCWRVVHCWSEQRRDLGEVARWAAVCGYVKLGDAESTDERIVGLTGGYEERVY